MTATRILAAVLVATLVLASAALAGKTKTYSQEGEVSGDDNASVALSVKAKVKRKPGGGKKVTPRKVAGFEYQGLDLECRPRDGEPFDTEVGGSLPTMPIDRGSKAFGGRFRETVDGAEVQLDLRGTSARNGKSTSGTITVAGDCRAPRFDFETSK